MSASAPHSRSTRVVLATVFVDVVALAMILPILPGIASRMGASPALIGVLVASYSAAQLLFATVWGQVSDRIGRRPVLLIGLAGGVVSYVVFALAGTWQILLLSRVLDGGSGATTNIAQAWLADETTPDRRTRAMGQVGATIGAGFIVGPILGGLSSTGGSALPGWIAAGITAINLIVAAFTLPAAPPPRAHPAAPATPASGRFQHAAPLGVLFLTTLAFSVMYVVFPLWGELSLGVERSTIGYWFAFIALVTAAVQGGPLGRLVARYGETRVARIGMALLAAGLAVLPFSFARGALGFYGALLVIGAGYGLAGPPILGLISRHTGPERQGKVLGVAQSTSASARIIGPIVAGIAMAILGAQHAFLSSAALALLAAALTLLPVMILRSRQAAPSAAR